MRPIDTIRTKIDSDFTKYHSVTLCEILSDSDVGNVADCGLCAIVRPKSNSNEGDPMRSGEENEYIVQIVNFSGKEIPMNVASRFNVMVQHTVPDRISMAIGYLVPKTCPTDKLFVRSGSVSGYTKDVNGKMFRTKTKENTL